MSEDIAATDSIHKEWNLFRHPMMNAPNVNLGTEASPQLFNVYDGDFELEC